MTSSSRSEAIALLGDLIKEYATANKEMPHAGALRDSVYLRTGWKLPDGEIKVLGAIHGESIESAPWWHDLDKDQAIAALKCWEQGDDCDDLALKWGIERGLAKNLINYGAAITGTKIDRHAYAWPATPEEEHRAWLLCEKGLSRAEVGEKVGRSAKWVRSLVKKMEKKDETRSKGS